MDRVDSSMDDEPDCGWIGCAAGGTAPLSPECQVYRRHYRNLHNVVQASLDTLAADLYSKGMIDFNAKGNITGPVHGFGEAQKTQMLLTTVELEIRGDSSAFHTFTKALWDNLPTRGMAERMDEDLETQRHIKQHEPSYRRGNHGAEFQTANSCSSGYGSDDDPAPQEETILRCDSGSEPSCLIGLPIPDKPPHSVVLLPPYHGCHGYHERSALHLPAPNQWRPAVSSSAAVRHVQQAQASYNLVEGSEKEREAMAYSWTRSSSRSAKPMPGILNEFHTANLSSPVKQEVAKPFTEPLGHRAQLSNKGSRSHKPILSSHSGTNSSDMKQLEDLGSNILGDQPGQFEQTMTTLVQQFKGYKQTMANTAMQLREDAEKRVRECEEEILQLKRLHEKEKEHLRNKLTNKKKDLELFKLAFSNAEALCKKLQQESIQKEEQFKSLLEENVDKIAELQEDRLKRISLTRERDKTTVKLALHEVFPQKNSNKASATDSETKTRVCIAFSIRRPRQYSWPSRMYHASSVRVASLT